MDKSFFQVLSKMSEIALSGVNECFVGDAWEIEAVARKYPLMVLDANLKQHSWQAGVLKLNVDLYIMDVVYEDESNELDVLSNMTKIGVDFVNYITNNLTTYGFYVGKNSGEVINFQSFTEKFDDKVAGVMFNISIQVPDDGNQCENIFNI